MLHKITLCAFLFAGILLGQQTAVEVTAITGEETNTGSIYSDVTTQPVDIPNQIIYGSNFIWNMHNITNMATGYDLQSNASAQQLWYDDQNNSLNAVFMTSQMESGWSDRTSSYFYSSNNGVTWSFVGQVPPSAPNGGAMSGFPAIHGLSFGSIVIANHSALGGAPTRTQLFINSNAGTYDFINFNPGITVDGGAIWPKFTVSSITDRIVIGSSINGGFGNWVNTFDLNIGTFSGWQFNPDGDQAETYQFATSVGGKIGNAFLDEVGGAWFRESTNNGITWNTPIKIFSPFVDQILPSGDTVYAGTLRGINVTYIGEIPKVVIEVYRVGSTFSTYYPGMPSDIYFWSPDVNNGNAFIIADTTNVPFYPNQGIVAVFAALNRPVIGKSIGDDAIFVTFFATTPDIDITTDTRIMAGYFMMSMNGGVTWSVPERFTPITNPPLDWRWVSIAPVNPVDGEIGTVHIVMVGDPIAGSQVNGAPPGVTAKFYHFSSSMIVVPVELISFTANGFKNDVTLEWITASEINNSGFEVQKKFNDEFYPVAFIHGHGTTTEQQSYSYDDKNVEPGNHYYRLKQIDFDGSFKYSDVVEVDVNTPYEYGLSQNYPNPFNPTTTIGYQIPDAGYVTLKIFDVLGNEISTLVNDFKPAGKYEVSFDASSLASGVYYYQLRAGNFIKTKKMILIR